MATGGARRSPAPAAGGDALGHLTREVGEVAVLVPVKAFSEAKGRLAPAVSPQGRIQLARTMATRVLRSAGSLPTAVVCDDRDVAAWARDEGALVIWQPEQGLNRAVEAGVARLGELGATRVVVAHGDLPGARGLDRVGDFDGVTLVPDRAGDGTPVICVPAGAGYRFSYGPGSFQRHLAEAHRLGLAVRISTEPGLRADVDLPTDLTGHDLPEPCDPPSPTDER